MSAPATIVPRVSLTLFVKERIRTVKAFLTSVNKNSFMEGHTVILAADVGWREASDPRFMDSLGEGNISLHDWLDRHGGDFPRIRLEVSDYSPQAPQDSRVLSIGPALNKAIREHVRTEWIVTCMPCSGWYSPNWDVNLFKWTGEADILIPRYIEPHQVTQSERTAFYSILQCMGYADLIYVLNSREDHILDVIKNTSLYPGAGILESPGVRWWSHAHSMATTTETFRKIGGFIHDHDPLRRNALDLRFDEAAGDAGLLKLAVLDSFFIRMAYTNWSVEFSQEIRPGMDGMWFLPIKKSLVRSEVLKGRLSPRDQEAIQRLPLVSSHVRADKRAEYLCVAVYAPEAQYKSASWRST